MKKLLTLLMLTLCITTFAQSRRPIDNRHPMWMIHVDVWNEADPQKIIDLVPEDIKPYVCMNLSLSCQYDKDLKIYKMPQDAIQTYRSWASVCCKNNLWFTCQPASGGHTHLQDDAYHADASFAIMESFFKDYKNFLGWNYAEQFWGFGEPNDASSSTDSDRIKFFARLVPMHQKYGGFLTISFCGNVWSHPVNPIGMMKRNADFLNACKAAPEAVLFLYKYTTSANWFNNESVTMAPFISGLAKNYGVRYDNCGWNGMIDEFAKENEAYKNMAYPGAVGVAPVLEQMALNGACVWDGPELIWTEDFRNLSPTKTADGYTQRNWTTFTNFDNIWVDMWRKVIDGTIYIPSREEVIARTKICIINDISASQDATSLKVNAYAAPIDLYHGLYLQDDPANARTSMEGGIGTINGYGNNNYLYFKKTGRYQTIPVVIDLFDNVAKKIPTQIKRSAINNKTAWANQAAKVQLFNANYPEISSGDLFVARNKNALVCYYPYSFMNEKTTASASIPLKYNTCQKVDLKFAQYSSAIINEYSNQMVCYFNNYRADDTSVKSDVITIYGAKSQPKATLAERRQPSNASAKATISESWNGGVYTCTLSHCGPCDLTIACAGEESNRSTDYLPSTALDAASIKQPTSYATDLTIEAEDMDYKNIASCVTHQYNWNGGQLRNIRGHSAMGFQMMGTNNAASLRWSGTINKTSMYEVRIKYMSKGAGTITSSFGDAEDVSLDVENTGTEWRYATYKASAKEGENTFTVINTGGVDMYIDNVTFSPIYIALNGVGNAEAIGDRHYFKTTTWAYFPSDILKGKKVEEVGGLYIECGEESTTGYRLDFEIFDAEGKKINDDWYIGSAVEGTSSSDPVFSKTYHLQELLSQFIKQYPGCTFGQIRLNTAIPENSEDNYFFTLTDLKPIYGELEGIGLHMANKHTSEEAGRYKVTGEQVNQNNRGFQIVRMKDGSFKKEIIR